MDRLVELLVKFNIKEATFILWNARHRITLAHPISSRQSMNLECVSVNKHYIPYLYSWYSQTTEYYSLEKKSYQSGDSSRDLKRYMVFDGHRLQTWGDAEGGKTKKELFERKDGFPSSDFKYKNTRYVKVHTLICSMISKLYTKDITLSMNNPIYMKQWLYDSQTRYKMMYKTLHFLARSGIDPSLFSKATGSFSDRVKKEIINRSKNNNGDSAYPRSPFRWKQSIQPPFININYRNQQIELLRY
jgi:hypothetical protein